VALTVDQVVELYRRRGWRCRAGDAVSQLEHALQCAMLALEDDAPVQLVAAALLHDFGHLVAELPPGVADEFDDTHPRLAMPFLRGTFPEAVTEPIRLHTDAKRYLCHTEPGYAASLSAASRRGLERAGGAFDVSEAARFLVQPFASEALRLRRWDDMARVPGARTPALEELVWVLETAALADTPVGAALL
jgi:predicted HD phosphohydrolase